MLQVGDYPAQFHAQGLATYCRIAESFGLVELVPDLNHHGILLGRSTPNNADQVPRKAVFRFLWDTY